MDARCNLRRDAFFVVCRVLCAKVVGATSSESLLGFLWHGTKSKVNIGLAYKPTVVLTNGTSLTDGRTATSHSMGTCTGLLVYTCTTP